MRKAIFILAAAFVLGTTGPALTSLHAQDAQATTETQSTTQTTTERVSTSETYMGKISKHDDQYVLENKDKKSSYKLDDAQKADHFDGKNVKVTGTLDNSTNMIHVQTIEEDHSS